MVFLTKPVKHSQDLRLSKLAFSLVDTLNQESSILLTKAISWLLRNLTKNHRQEVVSYLDSNKNLLPKIAVRETLNKLRTGRKSGI